MLVPSEELTDPLELSEQGSEMLTTGLGGDHDLGDFGFNFTFALIVVRCLRSLPSSWW